MKRSSTGALHQDPGPRAAILPGVVEHRVGRGRGGLLQIGIGEHDVGALPAQFQGEPLDLPRASGHHLAPDLGRPGEHDLPDRRMIDQALAHHPALARQHLQHPVGQAGLGRQLADPDGGQRGHLGRLGDHGVPRGQGRRHAPGQDRHREVPRHDQPDHADGLVEGDVQAAGHRNLPPGQPLGRGRVVVQDVADVPGLPAGLAERMTRAGDLQPGQFVEVGVDGGGEPAQQGRAVAGRDRAPAGLRGGRPVDGGVGLLRRGARHRGDRLLGGRIEDRELRHAATSLKSRRLGGLDDWIVAYRRSKQRRSSQSVTAAS